MCCIGQMDNEFKKLKDPIYGYIKISTELIKRVVDTAAFQRLRRVLQTSWVRLRGAEPSGGGDGVLEGGVDPPVGGDHLVQAVHIGGLELGDVYKRQARIFIKPLLSRPQGRNGTDTGQLR